MADSKSKPVRPIKADRKPKPIPELKLTEFQTFVCDLAGDMILRGGHDDDMNNVVYWLCAHYYRTLFPRRGDETASVAAERAEKFAEDRYREWIGRLRSEWPRPDEQPLPDGLTVNVVHPAPKGVVERIHATLRTELQGRLDDFMNEAGTDEKYLLRDILMDWEGHSLPADALDPRATLATAFTYQINDPHSYFKVPDKIKGLVESYIRLLLAGKEAEAAA